MEFNISLYYLIDYKMKVFDSLNNKAIIFNINLNLFNRNLYSNKVFRIHLENER